MTAHDPVFFDVIYLIALIIGSSGRGSLGPTY